MPNADNADNGNALSPTAPAYDFKRGVIAAVGFNLIWGFAPVYWKLLSGESSIEVLAWRMVWSGVFMIALYTLVKRIHILGMLRDRHAVKVFLSTAVLIAINWGLYIWATNSGFLLEASLGYYLNPLVISFVGMIAFREGATRAQKGALCLAAIGIVGYLAIRGGAIWITVASAGLFSAYGAIKKKAGYPALTGMAVESLLTFTLGLAITAIGALVPAFYQLTPATPDAIAATDPALIVILLIGTGLVSSVPLLLYSSAANDLPFVILGFLGYFSPTIETLLAVFMFGESFTFAHVLSFGFVWIGLIAVGIEAVHRSRVDS